MSKYELLWKYIKKQNNDKQVLTFKQIEDVLGFSIDHSFLMCKKELLEFGYNVNKISMKNQMVEFCKIR